MSRDARQLLDLRQWSGEHLVARNVDAMVVRTRTPQGTDYTGRPEQNHRKTACWRRERERKKEATVHRADSDLAASHVFPCTIACSEATVLDTVSCYEKCAG